MPATSPADEPDPPIIPTRTPLGRPPDLLPLLQAQLRQALMAVETRRRLALTGYPLQNNMLEM